MMKKIITTILIVFGAIALIGCTDRKTYDNRVNVIFFTANSGATKVDTLLNVEAGSKIEKPEDPTRAGFTFLGWYKDLATTIPWNFDVDVVQDKSILLYAGWEADGYEIIYVTYGGVLPDDAPTKFTVGSNVVLPIPRKEGYSFVAWYLYEWTGPGSTIPGDRGYRTLPTDKAEDVTLYAHWEEILVAVTYNLNYPGSEATRPDNVNSQMINYGTTLTEEHLPTIPDTPEYKFLGWNARRDGSGAYYKVGDVFLRKQRTTMYAQWEKI